MGFDPILDGLVGPDWPEQKWRSRSSRLHRTRQSGSSGWREYLPPAPRILAASLTDTKIQNHSHHPDIPGIHPEDLACW